MRIGDHIKHKPSKETWVVGAVTGGHVIPLGWPMGFVAIEDVEVTKEATDEEHWKIVKDLINMQEHSDPRHLAGVRALANRIKLEQPEVWKKYREKLELFREAQDRLNEARDTAYEYSKALVGCSCCP